jgi:hypothetical protein
MSPVDDPRAPPAVLSGVETPDLVSSGKNGDAFASADALFFLAGSIARGLAAAHSPAHDRLKPSIRRARAAATCLVRSSPSARARENAPYGSCRET